VIADHYFYTGHELTKPVIVLGAGGHAKVLLDTLACIQPVVHILGLADPAFNKRLVTDDGIPIFSDEREILAFSAHKILLVNGIGSVADLTLRTTLFTRWKQQHYHFAGMIHPSAILSSKLSLGEGCQIMAGAIVQTGSRLGDNVILNTKASVDHDCVIGNHVHLAPGVTLSGNVSIGEQTHVGSGATVIQGISIGAHCLIGAGAVVTQAVLARQQVMGVPAKSKLAIEDRRLIAPVPRKV